MGEVQAEAGKDRREKHHPELHVEAQRADEDFVELQEDDRECYGSGERDHVSS